MKENKKLCNIDCGCSAYCEIKENGLTESPISKMETTEMKSKEDVIIDIIHKKIGNDNRVAALYNFRELKIISEECAAQQTEPLIKALNMLLDAYVEHSEYMHDDLAQYDPAYQVAVKALKEVEK